MLFWDKFVWSGKWGLLAFVTRHFFPSFFLEPPPNAFPQSHISFPLLPFSTSISEHKKGGENEQKVTILPYFHCVKQQCEEEREKGYPDCRHEVLHASIRAHLHYMIEPCDLTHDSLVTFNNGLGLLKTKSGGGLQGGSRLGGMCWVGILSVVYYLASSRRVNDPLRFC